jgi:hypothetical protein
MATPGQLLPQAFNHASNGAIIVEDKKLVSTR